MVWDEEEKRKFFYVDKDELVEVGGFTDIDSAGNVVASWFPITRLMEKQEHGSRMIVKL